MLIVTQNYVVGSEEQVNGYIPNQRTREMYGHDSNVYNAYCQSKHRNLDPPACMQAIGPEGSVPNCPPPALP